MKKRRITIVFIMAILLFLLMGVNVSAQNLSIESKSAILMDAGTGEILFEQNKDERLPPASITKIMTMLLTMEAIESGKITIEDPVTISSYASQMGGTQLYIEAGETRTVEELLTGVAVESANDAAAALGEYLGGTQESFVKLMNDRAKELGMVNSQFKNTNGLPAEGHYSTAYDIALMSKELVEYEKIHKYLTMWMTDVTVGKNNDKVRTLSNTNKLLKTYDGLDGIKTGFTSQAKHCLSATAKKGNLRLISVILSADSSQIRFNEAAKLLDYGFANYEGINIAEKDEEIQEIIIEKGVLEKTKVVTENSLNVLIKKGEENKIEKKVVLDPSYKAPIEKGQKLGELIAYKGNQEIAKVHLIANETIEKSNLIYIYKKIMMHWLTPEKE